MTPGDIVARAFADVGVGPDGEGCEEAAALAVRRAIAEEREACAKECERLAATLADVQPRNAHIGVEADGADACAAAIRARP